MTILFDNGHFVYKLPHVCGVMVSVLASNVVVCGVPATVGSNKNYKIGVFCFAAKHITLRSKSK